MLKEQVPWLLLWSVAVKVTTVVASTGKGPGDMWLVDKEVSAKSKTIGSRKVIGTFAGPNSMVLLMFGGQVGTGSVESTAKGAILKQMITDIEHFSDSTPL